MIFLKKLSWMILNGYEVIENAVTSPIILIEPKSIDPEDEPWPFGKNYQMKTNFVMLH